VPEPEALFRWDTLTVIGPHDLLYQGQPVPGMTCEITLSSDRTITVWRAGDGKQYFCHGLTFGGKEAPGGVLSPYTGIPVETILEEHYQMIPEADAQPGDILVWRGPAPETTPHSAILTDPIVRAGERNLAYETRLQTKNGLSPETNMTLEKVIGIYGESYQAHRRR
jgi:hypothetical protein